MNKHTRIPLGDKEGLRLEFKSSEALNAPVTVAREIVGMLNAEGGAVWIGLREQDGTATSIEHIEDSISRSRALRDSLIDLIEPSPLDDEVEIEALEEGPICVQVTPKNGRAPYALLRGGAREFIVRVGDRNRPMSRQEVSEAFGSEASQPPGQEARERMVEAKTELARSRRPICWIRFEPETPMVLDLDSEALTRFLQHATATGNRLIGWNFTVPDDRPRVGKQHRWTGIDGYMKTTVYEWGGIQFESELKMLHWKGGDLEIWPFVLLELPTSLARLAKHVYQECGKEGPAGGVLADMALFGIKGWKLRPGSTGSLAFRLAEPRAFEESEDLTWNDPISVGMDQLIEAPDHVGFRLVRRAYEAFGYRESEIPREYDRERRRLVMP